ncbi:hypothetical protein A3A54_01205 [Candidatus Curtissbacteria bacterium RIFCSPLOWO2_01_FULL_39_62]|uniref:Glutamyl-tRNA amidotransferase n=2 Tax=Candidatus Curtissiibacteriota TaxID=1752717 RepID=A0A1F5GBC0_9BACT|nr:MAG: hypothetical protein A3D04_00470 [Candidatus Curtissbacteria bacterium RIFCSPHIGHO2_02_FULL_40_16b]OGD90617.1 MAG: hypothetical protein A3E11_01820 [Candidatus Curtissbacteria bacterium RIFCSPHIGHO2_12_FULL_38_37]OGE00324.1 MAG: hypothetical protein A3J17_01475 [Candidatus Curtissbacteria bacterium RIFCSPLOWO2_02_FULL_40_11]OGE00460.1 MAG: hypothetical protein A3A54_01205 [Candidatus Curtissbacteria bacterium RIFCSPLOWO2_01_FULL_39_62]OGE14305.1 MAG: hypothetical protein A3G14_04040 [Ca
MANLTQLEEDLISSLKAKNEVATSTLRLLISEIKNAQITKRGQLEEKEVGEVIGKSAKKHKESIEAYKKAERADLVEKEEAELKIVEKYLPEQMGEDEIGKVVDEVISTSGASGVADMGKVMGQVMGKLMGQADGNAVSQIVKKKLVRGKSQ